MRIRRLGNERAQSDGCVNAFAHHRRGNWAITREASRATARHLAGDVAGFERCARLACATAKDLAPYQSPIYRALVNPGRPDGGE
jgi:hypothetical protein